MNMDDEFDDIAPQMLQLRDWMGHYEIMLANKCVATVHPCEIRGVISHGNKQDRWFVLLIGSDHLIETDIDPKAIAMHVRMEQQAAQNTVINHAKSYMSETAKHYVSLHEVVRDRLGERKSGQAHSCDIPGCMTCGNPKED